ncbi:MAG: ExbD/TolR family protein [Lautropia sp.]
MAFGSLESDEGGPMAEINMVPLIDVMLVLMLVFMITAPLLTHSVNVRLPRASSEATPQAIAPLELSVDARGQWWIGAEPVDRPAMQARLRQAAMREPQPDVHLRAERTTAYEDVARLMSDASLAGLRRIGFVTDPRPTPGANR